MVTRGERNCNPGNIDRSPNNKWLGLSADQSSDPRFCVFDDMLHGVRALARLLLSYQHKDGCNTIRKIVSRWAPGGENNTQAYVDDVAFLMSYDPDDPINLDTPALLAAATRAIIRHENGRVLPSVGAVIAPAVSLALA